MQYPDNYRTCHRRAQRALQSGKFSRATLDAIDEDIARTLPSLHLFRPETGPMHQDLRDMLFAWVVSRSDEGLGYIPGAASIAAMFLINMDAPQGFIAMRNLLERHCMRSIYGGESTKEDVEAYYRIFDTLLADGMPKSRFCLESLTDSCSLPTTCSLFQFQATPDLSISVPTGMADPFVSRPPAIRGLCTNMGCPHARR